MQARGTTKKRLLAATLAVSVGGVAGVPSALAAAKPPVKPKAGSAKSAAKKAAGAQSGAREIVSIGYDSYSGLELYVVKVDGSVVGLPFG